MGQKPEPKAPPGVLIAVGRITKPHGVRGEAAVIRLSEVETRFQPGSRLLLEDGTTLTVEGSRPHGHRVLVKFREVADRTEVEALRGHVLLVPASETPSAPKGAYWVHQVIGLQVVTEAGREVGRVKAVLQNPANDLWVTEGPTGEHLIPALKEVVVDVDLESGRAVVREIEGITSEAES